MLMRGVDTHDNSDDEPRPDGEYTETALANWGRVVGARAKLLFEDSRDGPRARYTRPRRSAVATISVRDPTSSTARIFSRWSFTVCGLRWTRPAICLSVNPSERCLRIARSVSESAVTCRGPAGRTAGASPAKVTVEMTWPVTFGSRTDPPR